MKEHAQDVPLNPLGMWLNAINAVYQVSATDMRHVWVKQTYSLPRYGVDIILTSAGEKETDQPNLQTRFVIWTMQHVMYNIWNMRVYKPFVGLPKWHGHSVGLVQIWKKEQASIGNVGNNTDDMNELVLPANRSSYATASPVPADTTGLRYTFEFGATRLNSENIFLAALEGLAEAAESGLDSRCAEFDTHGYSVVAFDLLSLKDQHGNPLLRYGHVREVLQRSIYHMVAARRFSALDVKVFLDGRLIAQGGWKDWTRRLAANGTAQQ